MGLGGLGGIRNAVVLFKFAIWDDIKVENCGVCELADIVQAQTLDVNP